jgi:hypothetical protein
LQDAQASFLLGRADVSPDTSKAADKLGEQLSDLDPFRARQLPVPKWSRNYLGGLTSYCGSFKSCCVRLEQHGQPEEAPWSISESDKDFIRGMPGLQRQHQQIRPLKQKSVSAYSMKLKPGWVKAPEPDAPEYVDLLETIRALLKLRKRCTTIAKVLNATHVPPRFGKTWHHTGVRLIARRAGLIKTAPVIGPVPLADSPLSPPKPRNRPKAVRKKRRNIRQRKKLAKKTSKRRRHSVRLQKEFRSKLRVFPKHFVAAMRLKRRGLNAPWVNVGKSERSEQREYALDALGSIGTERRIPSTHQLTK